MKKGAVDGVAQSPSPPPSPCGDINTIAAQWANFKRKSEKIVTENDPIRICL
jgi:hypothetical protein